MQGSENQRNSQVEEISGEAPYDLAVDLKSYQCPMPLLKMKQALKPLAQGQTLRVEVSDPASLRDFKAYIGQTSHQLKIAKQANYFIYWITKN
ncbi:sulfurtransferase TusA family protein [Aliikangiella sp. IMCC44653]